MEQTSFEIQTTIVHQFDQLCKKVLKGKAIDYKRHLAYVQANEIFFSELSPKDVGKIATYDVYNLDIRMFHVFGYDVEVTDPELCDAIKKLSTRKQEVVLMAYFLDMSDAEIARRMNLVRSTVHEHRKKSLEMLKTFLGGNKSEKNS